jgi:FlaA1/EpsC-like NDP-sugar epimerase
LRPGEKLDEQLVYPYETVVQTDHPLVKEVCAKAGVRVNGHGTHFEKALRDLIAVAEVHGDRRSIVAGLMLCVPEYAPLDGMPLETPVSVT